MSFVDGDELFRYVGRIFEVAFADPEIGPKLAGTGVVLRVRCTEPDNVMLVDAAGRAVHNGEAEGLQPSATISMKGELANAYWQGKVNMPIAMARGKITVEGNVASLLRLAPVMKKLFPVYIENLRSAGRADLLV